MLVEDVPIEGLHAVVHLRADLAWVESADLYHDAGGTFSPAVSQMALGVPLGLEGLLTARALLVRCGVLIRVVLPLLPQALHANLRVLRELGGHRPLVLLAFGRSGLFLCEAIFIGGHTLVLLDGDLLLLRGPPLLAGVARNGLLA